MSTTTQPSPTAGAGSSAASDLLQPHKARPFPWSSEQGKALGIYGFDSRDIRSRPFNLLRSRILKLNRAHGWRIFGVVSATPGVGKSFVASNMAAALSRTPSLATYLIDLDLRRGSIAENFRFLPEMGIRAYLEEEENSFGLCVPEGERLLIVPTDASSAHSAELLATERMEQLVQALRDLPKETIVICDLPPVFANDDAAIVASKLDAYLLVVEDGRSTKKQIRDSIKVLSPSPCAGVVLNRYHGGLVSDSYGYSYGATGSYGAYFKD
jgi:Mrp family chromosome partitioning ATPase